MNGRFFRLIKSGIAPESYGWAGHFRWPLMSIAVGVVSGFGAILFETLLRRALHFFLYLPTGYLEPLKGASVSTVAGSVIHSWWFLLIPALGGLVSGVIVYLRRSRGGGSRHRCHDRGLPSNRAAIFASGCPWSRFWRPRLPSAAAVLPARRDPLPKSAPVSGPSWPRS